MPAAKPLVMVGRSASSRSRVSAGVDGVGAHQRGSGDQRGEQAEREAADPEERRIAEQPVVGGQPADRVEVALMVEQRGVGVHRALGRAGRPRGVDDGQRVRCRRRRLPAPRQRRTAASPSRCRVEDDVAQLRCGAWRVRGEAERCDVEGLGQPPDGSRGSGTRSRQQDRRRHCRRVARRSSGAVEKVVNGTTTAPIRAAASIADHEVRAVGIEQADVGALAGTQRDEAAGQSRRAVGRPRRNSGVRRRRPAADVTPAMPLVRPQVRRRR